MSRYVVNPYLFTFPASALHFWDRRFKSHCRYIILNVKRVSQCSAGTRGFPQWFHLPGTPVFSHRESPNVDRVELQSVSLKLKLSICNWTFHRNSVSWSDMNQKVAIKGALWKLTTQSSWTAFFAVQFTFQLQVRMINTRPLAHSRTYMRVLSPNACAATRQHQH